MVILSQMVEGVAPEDMKRGKSDFRSNDLPPKSALMRQQISDRFQKRLKTFLTIRIYKINAATRVAIHHNWRCTLRPASKQAF